MTVAMISNAKLLSTIHSTVMNALVVAARNRKEADETTIALEVHRIEMVMKFLEALSLNDTGERDRIFTDAKESEEVMMKDLNKARAKNKETDINQQITLADAMMTLEDVDIDVSFKHQNQADPLELSGAMMAHTEAATRFNRHQADGED